MLLRDHVYHTIRQAILNCEFAPGQELREQTLAERLHVSRSPIRDSLLRLEQENLVTVLPRQGYLVNPISLADIEDIFGLRLLIEPACAAAAARRDDATLRTLDVFRDFPHAAAPQSAFFEYNIAFHRTVSDLSGNARMAAVGHDLVEQFERLVRISLHGAPMVQIARLVEEHNAIIDAIQARDVDTASRLSYEHAEAGRLRVANVLEPGAVTAASDSGQGATVPASPVAR